jgi:oligopeptide transport system substrate-binding protein
VNRAPLAVVVIAACGLPDGEYFGRIPEHIDPQHFVWCNAAEPDYLDPARASSTASTPLISALYIGLTAYGPDGNAVPSLATHWEIDDELRAYTFHLRRDARWSNGRPVTAYDIAYSAIRVLHPLTGSPNGDNIAALKSARTYLTRSVFVLQRAVGPYRAGDVVMPAGDGEAPHVELRTSSRALALRDLGAAPAAAYAHVPPGTQVTLVMTSGGYATPPAPDAGEPWAYVFWARDHEGVFGWVHMQDLDGEPAADIEVAVKGVPVAERPSWASGGPTDSPTVRVHGRDLAYSPDAIGMRVVDPYTIAFECTDPTPFLLALTPNRALRTAPIEAVSRWPLRWTSPGLIITSGPLHLVAWKRRDRVELVRSPTYFDQAAIKSERVTVLSTDDQAAATNLYYTGACDATATNHIPSTYLPALNGELRGKAYKDFRVDPWLTVYFAWINTEKLSNRHLRRALSLAIDRTQIPRFTHGNEMPTSQLTPGTPIAQLSDADLAACGVARTDKGFALVEETGQLCYVPPPGLDYDPVAAKRELDEARRELGRAWKEPLEYRYNAGSEAHKQIAEYLQAAWERIGLRVVITAQEFNSLLDDTRKGNYEISRLGAAGTIPDTESDFLVLLHCGSPDNRGRYCSPEFERLMTEARTIRDRHARNAKLREAEAVALADAPLIPLYVYTQKHLIKPYVRDYAINLLDQVALWRIWNDPDWTRR